MSCDRSVGEARHRSEPSRAPGTRDLSVGLAVLRSCIASDLCAYLCGIKLYRSALHMACLHNRAKTAQFLLNRGALVEVFDWVCRHSITLRFLQSKLTILHDFLICAAIRNAVDGVTVEWSRKVPACARKAIYG